MEEIIEIIYKEVKRRCLLPTNAYGIGAWDHHIKLVYEIAIDIYKQYGAEYDIVALASLLHDIASVTNKEAPETPDRRWKFSGTKSRGMVTGRIYSPCMEGNFKISK